MRPASSILTIVGAPAGDSPIPSSKSDRQIEGETRINKSTIAARDRMSCCRIRNLVRETSMYRRV